MGAAGYLLLLRLISPSNIKFSIELTASTTGGHIHRLLESSNPVGVWIGRTAAWGFCSGDVRVTRLTNCNFTRNAGTEPVQRGTVLTSRRGVCISDGTDNSQ